ncbi:Inactive RHOMBOID-like protein, partial [Drosera capensis]
MATTATTTTPRTDPIPIDIIEPPPISNASSSIIIIPGGSSSDETGAPMSFFSVSKSRDSSWVISLIVLVHLVVFVITMFKNNCWQSSHGDCTFRVLGRFSFQPLYENPLLGPSASTLDKMGALREKQLVNVSQIWRLFTSPWLHAGALHLIISLATRVGIIYICSGFTGALIGVLFVRSSPEACSSGALFGLVGSMLSELIRNWNTYNKKILALVALCFISTINFIVGLLPHVDNFASLGGFISGFLLGFVLFFSPQLGEVVSNKGIFEYGTKRSIAFKQKLDRPLQRSISLVVYCFILICCLIMVIHGVSLGEYCSWCKYMDCVPSRSWTCDTNDHSCLVTISGGQLTITCIDNDNFRVLPFSSFTPARLEELCKLI